MLEASLVAGEQVGCLLLEKVRYALSDVMQQPESYYGYAAGETGGPGRRYQAEGLHRGDIEQAAQVLEQRLQNMERDRTLFKDDKEFLSSLSKYASNIKTNPASSMY